MDDVSLLIIFLIIGISTVIAIAAFVLFAWLATLLIKLFLSKSKQVRGIK